jgi:hypothetical protein
VAILPQVNLSVHKLLRRSKYPLHAAAAKPNLMPADALRRTAFLDVSSLNFGGATSTAVFFSKTPNEGLWGLEHDDRVGRSAVPLVLI